MKALNLTTPERLARVKLRRQKLRDLGLCINGSLTGKPSKRTGRVHGVVIHGGRCAVCLESKGG